MSLGRFMLGGFVPISVQCRDADQPYAPLEAPTYRVYDENGLLADAGRIPPADVPTLGVFIFNLRLDDLFGEGQHSVVIQYVANGSPRLAVQHFEIVPGGDPDGAIISNHYYERPMASYILGKLDSNQRFIGKNPRVSQ